MERVDEGHIWTIDTSTSIMDERDSHNKKLFLRKGDYTGLESLSTSSSELSTVSSGEWCMIFDKFNPQFKDRTTDTSLNAEFGPSYPNFEYDRWDDSAATSITTTAHPFQIDDAFGPSNDYCCREGSKFRWTYSWSTTQADLTSLGSDYPTFSRDSGNGNS